MARVQLACDSRAPRSRQDLENHYHFCQPHAGEYNKRWNFFEGMSEGEQKKFREGAQTGHRPTWEFKASRGSREAAAFAAKFGSGAAGKGAGAYGDKFDLFGGGGSGPKVKAETRQLGKLEQRALAELDLEMSADTAAIRTRYPRPRQTLPPRHQRRRSLHRGEAAAGDPRLQGAAEGQASLARVREGRHDRSHAEAPPTPRSRRHPRHACSGGASCRG